MLRESAKLSRSGSNHARALVVAMILVASACTSARAEDLSGYDGARLYKTYCASCHGEDGHGFGPVAGSLKVEVPDLTRIAVRHDGKFPADQIRKIIDGRLVLVPHGTRTMPVWGRAFSVADASAPQKQEQADRLIDLLVEYVRSLQVP